MVVVGSAIDAASERILKYLSGTHGININAATFQYFNLGEGIELLTRVFFIEPSRIGGTSKRRPNLTIDELDTLAEQAGVSELYSYAVSVFGPPLLRKSTTLSSIRFEANLAGSRRVLLSLIPGDSSRDRGLHFQVYGYRYADLAKFSVEEVKSLMPVDHQDWEFVAGGGSDVEGFEGFIRTTEDVDRIAEPLRSVEATQ